MEEDDDDDEFKSLLFVYDGKSATSVEEVKRFSATKIQIIEINSKEIKQKKKFSQANTISIISIYTYKKQKKKKKLSDKCSYQHKKHRWTKGDIMCVIEEIDYLNEWFLTKFADHQFCVLTKCLSTRWRE